MFLLVTNTGLCLENFNQPHRLKKIEAVLCWDLSLIEVPDGMKISCCAVCVCVFVFLPFYLVGRVSHLLLVSVFARMQTSTILPLHLHQINYKAIDSKTS